MVDLIIQRVDLRENAFEVHWDLDDYKRLFRPGPLRVSYGFRLEPSPFYAFNSFLAFALPIMVKEYHNVRIVSDYPIDQDMKAYWERLLQAFDLGGHKLSWTINTPTNSKSLQQPGSLVSRGRSALLFGGGIQSCFALSVLHRLRPVLVSVIGRGWMNNDVRRLAVKRRIEDRLAADHDVTFERIESNAFALIRRDDPFKNYHVTGLMFYWFSVPVCREYGISTLYQSTELEYALYFGEFGSLSPGFLKNIPFDSGPLFLPLFCCYTDMQMLDHLSRTPFLKYVYSCFRNRSRRWCGNCPKCHRVSVYCERLGIDKKHIDMQEGITGERPLDGLAGLHWDMMDRLYDGKVGIDLLPEEVGVPSGV